MVFEGSIANINAALNGLVYAPNNGYLGTETISLTANDLGNSGVGGALSTNSTVLIYVDSSRFLQGNYLEVSINNTGSLGSYTPAPVGYVNAGSILGVIADADRDGWANYDGDFILPGSPQEEWGVTIGGATYRNSTNGLLQEIAGNVGLVNDNGAKQTTDWIGATAGLSINNQFSVNRNDLFMEITVTLTNTTGGALTDLYYYRSVDADNNFRLNADFSTTNTILSQGDDGSGIALVSATQPDGSYMSLQGFGSNARVAYGNFNLIDPVKCIYR